jgi:hypothetical protein
MHIIPAVIAITNMASLMRIADANDPDPPAKK